MGKNRSMQAKRAKAIRFAIEDSRRNKAYSAIDKNIEHRYVNSMPVLVYDIPTPTPKNNSYEDVKQELFNIFEKEVDKLCNSIIK